MSTLGHCECFTRKKTTVTFEFFEFKKTTIYMHFFEFFFKILYYWCKNQSYYWLVTSWLLCYVNIIVFYTLLVKILVMYSFYNKI